MIFCKGKDNFNGSGEPAWQMPGKLARALAPCYIACPFGPIIAFCLLLLAPSSFAQNQTQYVEFTPQSNSVRLLDSGIAAPILIDSQDHPGVIRAAGDLRADIKRVARIEPRLVIDQTVRAADVVIVGTLRKNRLIDQLAQSGKLKVTEIQGHWEAFTVQVVTRPFPGVDRALVIAGSDKRGTIFGLYDLSEQIGVSPWYWWADVPAQTHASLSVAPGTNIRQEPKVKYRGFFINDEAPALTGMVKEKFGTYNHEFYAHVFELLLRLKANFLWPAMWDSAFNDDDKLNPKLADEYGIVMSTSHHEPMMRAQQEWKRYGSGAWDYEQNGEILRQFWTEGVRRDPNFERIITLGMRGDGDMPMSAEANTKLLERIVADQRKIIAENLNPNLAAVPQVWALYKEVQEYYEKGMRVPDDVTLLWSDDNWGNIRRLPTAEERRRSGGAGVYYHIDYVGGPRSYKWVNTVPITKIWEQLHLAYEFDARRIWLVNVGDIKPSEFPTEFFLRMAWDPEHYQAEGLSQYTRDWAARNFGDQFADEIADLIAKYTKYNGRRKPEQWEPNTYSLVNYREAETVVADYQKLAERAGVLQRAMPPELRDAFFQLVGYPIKACANLQELYYTVGKNRLYALQGRAATNDLAFRARELFRWDADFARYYNQTMSGGKWNHMMDQTHIGYTYWNQPPRNAMPGVQELQIQVKGEMGVAVEGSESTFRLNLPMASPYDQKPHYFEIFNMGQTPFQFTAVAKEPWLRLSQTNGSIEKEQRIFVEVDWAQAPSDIKSGSVEITGPNERKLTVTVPVVKTEIGPDNQPGFIEADGYVSIEAEHYTNAQAPAAFSWKLLPDFGRTLSGLTVFPVTAPLPDKSMRLEYRMFLVKGGPVSVDAYFAPTQMFRPTGGLSYAIAFDDEPPQTINFHAGYNQLEWERSVSDGVRVINSKHQITGPGYHTLKFWAVDPGLVIEKFVVNTGGLRPSYLGPPESYRR
ncbi:MAG: glycosyl hydrolase 115 family protein [Pyrinomonadaceae bacterium]